MMDDRQILDAALKKWGRQSQLDMAVGEIGELLTLFGREAQGRATPEEWQEEIADVVIMTAQLGLMFGPDNVQKKITEKMERLRKKVEEAV